MKLALNQAEAAEALGISVPTFRDHVRPHIRRVDIGKRMLFPVSDIQAWLDRHASTP